eukprot:1060726_1
MGCAGSHDCDDHEISNKDIMNKLIEMNARVIALEQAVIALEQAAIANKARAVCYPFCLLFKCSTCIVPLTRASSYNPRTLPRQVQHLIYFWIASKNHDGNKRNKRS